MVNILIGGTVAQRVLTHLARRPSETFFEQQVASEAATSIGAAHNALHRLSDLGLLRQERKGRRCFYQADLGHPLVRQWKVLGTLIELEPVLGDLRGAAERIVLFGSCAAGTDTEDSDIDLYVRTTRPDEVERLVDASGLAGRIQLVARTVLEEVESQAVSPIFFENVNRGLVLYDTSARS